MRTIQENSVEAAKYQTTPFMEILVMSSGNIRMLRWTLSWLVFAQMKLGLAISPLYWVFGSVRWSPDSYVSSTIFCGMSGTISIAFCLNGIFFEMKKIFDTDFFVGCRIVLVTSMNRFQTFPIAAREPLWSHRAGGLVDQRSAFSGAYHTGDLRDSSTYKW